eukprot:GEZU01021304.1.p1 GENE.GEZU01021304.1~~GEZU01021304.1.p1  ORF type:complete len:518 (-),score=100.24 GEZU01021304.1:431-1795(-)
MSDPKQSNTSASPNETPVAGVGVLVNDGSFLERFKQIQEEQEKQAAAAKAQEEANKKKPKIILFNKKDQSNKPLVTQQAPRPVQSVTSIFGGNADDEEDALPPKKELPNAGVRIGGVKSQNNINALAKKDDALVKKSNKLLGHRELGSEEIQSPELHPQPPANTTSTQQQQQQTEGISRHSLSATVAPLPQQPASNAPPQKKRTFTESSASVQSSKPPSTPSTAYFQQQIQALQQTQHHPETTHQTTSGTSDNKRPRRGFTERPPSVASSAGTSSIAPNTSTEQANNSNSRLDQMDIAYQQAMKNYEKIQQAHRDRERERELELSRHQKRGHHIGDFLPPELLPQYVPAGSTIPATSSLPQETNKINSSNIGHQMLTKMGWSEGRGLGSTVEGSVEPVASKIGGAPKTDKTGVGVADASKPSDSDDVYEQYKKRMMMAYRHRPNPLNNPRKQYY